MHRNATMSRVNASAMPGTEVHSVRRHVLKDSMGQTVDTDVAGVISVIRRLAHVYRIQRSLVEVRLAGRHCKRVTVSMALVRGVCVSADPDGKAVDVIHLVLKVTSDRIVAINAAAPRVDATQQTAAASALQGIWEFGVRSHARKERTVTVVSTSATAVKIVGCFLIVLIIVLNRTKNIYIFFFNKIIII